MNEEKYKNSFRRTTHWGLFTLIIGLISFNWRTDSSIDEMRHRLSGALIVVSTLSMVMTWLNKRWERRNK